MSIPYKFKLIWILEKFKSYNKQRTGNTSRQSTVHTVVFDTLVSRESKFPVKGKQNRTLPRLTHRKCLHKLTPNLSQAFYDNITWFHRVCLTWCFLNGFLQIENLQENNTRCYFIYSSPAQFSVTEPKSSFHWKLKRSALIFKESWNVLLKVFQTFFPLSNLQ